MSKSQSKKTRKKPDRITEYSDDEACDNFVDITEIPKQAEFYKMPSRFGSTPVDDLPMGCDKEKQYYKAYPRVALPFQKADRVTFGHPKLKPNRLFWGDNLHVMRMLPSNSIDLIYLDPPFFSGKNYNVIFGDQNEIRSFSDVWEGGMTSYLVWLNARLLEMKRLLKSTGSLYVHLDWHAAHYVKVELDKIFGYDNFLNEIIWEYRTGGSSKNYFSKKHDIIFIYKKSNDYIFNIQKEKAYTKSKSRKPGLVNYGAGNAEFFEDENGVYNLVNMRDVWDIPYINSQAKERIGYPTQKPEALLERIIKASTNEGDVVADFFCGGGTLPSTAQKLNRKWIACDQSRVAVAITQGRLEALHEKSESTGIQQTVFPIPDISVEYWGTYEIPALEALTDIEFRNFVISAYGGKITSGVESIHGYKNQAPLFVGPAKQKNRITKDMVAKFACEITQSKGYTRGIMLGWAFASSAKIAVEKLKKSTGADIDLIKITLTELDSTSFKEHIYNLHDEYKSLLTFILPPEVSVHNKKIEPRTYDFNASESMAMNPGASIVNVQWDFDYSGRFTPTQGFAYGRESGDEIKPLFKVTYKFKHIGKILIACRVQDDLGGEKIYTELISVR